MARGPLLCGGVRYDACRMLKTPLIRTRIPTRNILVEAATYMVGAPSAPVAGGRMNASWHYNAPMAFFPARRISSHLRAMAQSVP
jgi:hypothetical protein